MQGYRCCYHKFTSNISGTLRKFAPSFLADCGGKPTGCFLAAARMEGMEANRFYTRLVWIKLKGPPMSRENESRYLGTVTLSLSCDATFSAVLWCTQVFFLVAVLPVARFMKCSRAQHLKGWSNDSQAVVEGSVVVMKASF